MSNETELLPVYNDELQNATKKLVSNLIRELYKKEVPTHNIVEAAAIERDKEFFKAAESDPKLAIKAAGMTFDINKDVRHAAIRLALPEELEFEVRIMNLLNCLPIGSYDLTPEGTPFKSLVLRPASEEDITADGYRQFNSMLDPDSIKYKTSQQREVLDNCLEKRRELHFTGKGCYSLRLFELVSKGETIGFTEPERQEFVKEVLNSYKLRDRILVTKDEYEMFKALDMVVADVMGPAKNLNHTTDNSPEIKKLYDVLEKTLVMNGFVYGPKGVDILLEQSSVKAETNTLGTADGKEVKLKTRFIEFEERHQPVSRSGREIYDNVLGEILSEVKELRSKLKAEIEAAGLKYENEIRDKTEYVLGRVYDAKAQERFPKAYPDNDKDMALQGLVFYKYEIDEKALASNKDKVAGILEKIQANSSIKFSENESENQKIMAQKLTPLMEALVDAGVATRTRTTYHDFLPASAAGIFSSNKDHETETIKTENSIFKWMRENLGVIDFYDLYEGAQAKNMNKVVNSLKEAGLNVAKVVTADVDGALKDAMYKGDADRLKENHRTNIIPALAAKFERDQKKYLGGVTTNFNGSERNIDGGNEQNRAKA